MTPETPDEAADALDEDPPATDEATRRDRGGRPVVPPQLRQAVAVIALVAMAAGLLIAIVSIMDAIATWLKPRYVDLAQGAFGLVLAGASLAALAWIAREWDGPEG